MKTIFEKIIDREIPAKIVYEDDEACAFHDINPQAPVHILIVPKKPIATLADVAETDAAMVGRLVHRAARIAEQEGLKDYRFVVNNGAGAGQTVFHLHLHILGGRAFGWPPG